MTWLTNLLTGLKSLFSKRRTERELDEELESYIEAAAAHERQLGAAPEAARHKALADVGSRNAVKHRVWASRWESSFEALVQDVRFAIRQLIKTPGFTIVALLSLALGIGANTAIFTLFNAVLLRSLPVPQPQQLLLFGKGSWRGSFEGMPNRSWQLFSYPFFRAFAEQTKSFSGVLAVDSIQMGSHISINGGTPEHVRIDLVSGSYFSVLGVPPAMGRTLQPADDRAPGAGPVAVASYGWFQRHYQGNPTALGRSVRIQGHEYTIVGVAQPGFIGLAQQQPTDLWIPLSMEKEVSPGWNGLNDHDFQSLYLIGRLRPGVSLAEAQIATNLLFRQIIRGEYLGDHPSAKDLADLQHASINLTSAAGGLADLRLQFSGPLEILMGIVALVLLIAAANIANMLLARGVARCRELAVRQALGATRRRIAIQLFTESFLLAIAGASLGILIAWRGTHLLLALASSGPEAIPLDLTPDYRVLGFTLAITVVTALLFGIAPALRATRLELTPALKEGRGGSSASARGALSRSLIVGQIALSILLLAAAGLFLRSLRNLTHVDLGFDPQHVLVFSLDEAPANLPVDSHLIQAHQQIERSVESLPGVQSDGFSFFTFNEGAWSDPILVKGVAPTHENSNDVLYNVIGTGFLRTFGIPLLAGRNFTPQDTATSPPVAIVNETLVRQFFPTGSPLGHTFCLLSDSGNTCQNPLTDIEIIGVVRDAKYVSLGETPQMVAYFPYTQHNQYFGNFSVRSSDSPAALIPAVRNAIAQINPQIAIAQVEPLADQVSGSIATPRLVGLLSAFFAGLAVFLAAIGIYGLMSYSVARRSTELGIRLALGSQVSALLWLVLRESLLLLAVGLLIGLPAALFTARSLADFLKSQLYQVGALDPFVFIAAAASISVMTLLAGWIPARRATRVDPMSALRCE
ncbi:MAG TPA: ABC transporter permease [Terracidiphilus sp.]|nr:ABC transporter permease [Terracidiphilus sp.]